MKRIKKIGTCCLLMLGVAVSQLHAQVQNTLTEVLPFEMIGGRIVVDAVVNGEPAKLALDLSGRNSLLPEACKRLHVDADGRVKTVAVGNNLFASNLSMEQPSHAAELQAMKVDGTLNSSLFHNSVLTIDTKRQRITLTQPYRPSYMKLNYRENMERTGEGMLRCPITVGTKVVTLVLDTWCPALIALTGPDYSNWTGSSSDSLPLADVTFVKTKINGAVAVRETALKHSVIGNKLLEVGILSIDYIHQKLYFQPFDLVPIPAAESKVTKIEVVEGKLNAITRQYFLDHIFDYRQGGDFVLKGDKPVVIDFWATWCGPCMRMLPDMERLAEHYKGRVIFYKVNADKEKELCEHFKIRALPTLFFIPVGGKPTVEVGANLGRYEELLKTMTGE